MKTSGGTWMLALGVLLVLAGGAAVVATNLPRGLRNNNPGNIEKTPAGKPRWQGEIDGTDPRFATFDTMANGVRALGKLLMNYQRLYRIDTVRGIISRWAPGHENNTEAYVAAVAAALKVQPNERLDMRAKLPELVRAIASHENGAVATLAHLRAADLTEGVGRALA